MARTGFWFQFARGRALARTNAMNRARRIRRVLERGDVSAMRDLMGGEYKHQLSESGVREVLEHMITLEVKRAREANREHRKYRARHIETGD